MDLKQIIADLVAERDRLDMAIKTLGGVTGNRKAAGATTAAPKRRRISAAGRKRIIAAQRKRWAAVKAKAPAKKAS